MVMYVSMYVRVQFVRWQKLLGSARGGSIALSYQNCVITPRWRLMRTWYCTYFHTLYDEKKKKKMYVRVQLIPLPWIRCDTRSIFKWSIDNLNSEFRLFLTGCLTKAKEHSLPCCLPISRGITNEFIPFLRALLQSGTQTVSVSI